MLTFRYLAGRPACLGVLSLLALSTAAGCGDSKPAATPDGGDNTDTSPDMVTDTPVLGTPQKLVILHTNDIHSHLQGEGPEADYTPATLNDDTTVGGMARLATAVITARAQAKEAGETPVLLLDAGDFMMGTMFELLATANPPELAFMHTLGYDATTIGNHELDWTPRGLAGLLAAADRNQTTVPILASNLHFSDVVGDGDDELQALVTAKNLIQPKLIKPCGTLKVGFFGLLGADAVQVTPQSKPLTFDPIAAAAAKMVKELRETDKVDLVIALSHSGISADGTGEDTELAKAVPGIDVIISGHTHDKLDQPVRVGSTLIVTAGSYGRYLGKLEVTVTPGASPPVMVDKYTLIAIDDTIIGEPITQSGIAEFIGGINSALAPAGLAYGASVAETTADLTLPTYSEAPVGNLVTDAYRRVAAAVQVAAQLPPPVIAVEANGQIRSPILKGTTGQVWLADLFRVLPIGIGPDAKPGYPLVTFYLNAKDLRAGLELDAAGPLLSDQYFLQISGIKATYDVTKPLFGRITSLSKVDDLGTATPMDLNDTTKCYKVVATNYVAGLLGLIKTLTSGVLEVAAKDADCATLIDPTSPTRYVDADPTMDGVQELKHWQALLKYVTNPAAFPDANANTVREISAYATTQGRIVKQ